ncbi:hypothetical protein SOVF_122200 [Spinacia oleracea]|nr:hypothetical protein SOVF_122200 [Spinacia oleracea]
MFSLVEATRLPGGMDNWYAANSLRILERPANSPPPYPKPAPPERQGVVTSNLKNRYDVKSEESENILGRPRHPPPSYPKPAPPERYVTSTSDDQLSVYDYASTYSYRSTI